MAVKSTARKCPIGEANNHWWMRPPMIEVSLYPALTGSNVFLWKE